MKPTLSPRPAASRAAQRGGFFIGLIIGLLIGLAVSLAVALYVTKVPVPFINKVPQRSAEQDAAQAEKNRNWDPNAALAGKSASRPAASASAAAPLAVAPPASTAKPAAPADTAAAKKKDAKDAPASAAASAADPFTYFVQAGAYARTEDAEQQRANLAMMGFSTKVTEREQAGRMVYRVRVGPFDTKGEADATKEKLDAAGVDSALVRVQR